MIDLHEEGFLPHIQVHDELNLSVENPEQYSVIKRIMENCVELKVKCKVDVEVGNSWGEIKEIHAKDLVTDHHDIDTELA